MSRQDVTIEELDFGSSRHKKIEHNISKIKSRNLQVSVLQTLLFCSIRHVGGSSR